MLDINMEYLSELLDEVVGLVSSPGFLSGKDAAATKVYTFGDINIAWAVTEVSEYIRAIDVNNDDTPFLEMENRILLPIRKFHNMVHSYGLSIISDFQYSKFEKIDRLVTNSDRVHTFAKSVAAAEYLSNDPENTWSHILTTMLNHLNTVMSSRTILLSRRFAPVETLFNAYKDGLFPFGWVWGDADSEIKIDTILCLRPPAI